MSVTFTRDEMDKIIRYGRQVCRPAIHFLEVTGSFPRRIQLLRAGEKAHDFTFSLYFDLKNNTNWVSRPGLGLDEFLACAKEALSQAEIESKNES